MQGDFEAFYLRHYKAIYRVCYAFMKNAQDAEDCTEDVFVRAMTGELTFENERHERSWLTTTAMNLCKDRLKHWWRQKVTPIDEAAEQAAPEAEDHGEVVAVGQSGGLPDAGGGGLRGSAPAAERSRAQRPAGAGGFSL